jgi:hypothetical protein
MFHGQVAVTNAFGPQSYDIVVGGWTAATMLGGVTKKVDCREII